MWLLVLAQVTDPISGGAGWVGAGLLGLVLGWLLLIHIPNKDKQITNLITEFGNNSKEERKDFKEALDLVVQHCERETIKVNEGTSKVHSQLQLALETAREIASSQKRG